MNKGNTEIQEILNLLEECGLCPQLCDANVPYFDAGIRAGAPTDNGDSVCEKYLRLPKEMVDGDALVVARVKGDSMKDAGIYSGDRILVRISANVYDGDIVVASIDGECTVKAYCEDEQGCRWLVPRNEAYNAIPLTEDKNVRIIGKVVEITRDAPRTSYAELMKTIKRTRGRANASERRLTPERVRPF